MLQPDVGNRAAFDLVADALRIVSQADEPKITAEVSLDGTEQDIHVVGAVKASPLHADNNAIQDNLLR